MQRNRYRDIGLLMLLVLVMALPGLADLPVIDRDEARYAQASVQMMESGDYINIHFQDTDRNKKPAGAYWLQSLSVNAFSNVEDRAIWAHRLPSVMAALIAVLATYLGGIRMVGRESAFIGSTLLATSMMFVFEAHIAKTDALLCATAAVCLASFGTLRNGGGRKSALIFWTAMGCAVLIKGPILPLLVGLCSASLIIWERKAAWLKPLTYWLGPLIFFAIILPWGILIWRETNGTFFTEAIGGDLTPKLKGGHERHGGPIGYYMLTTWLAFWPACLFLLPGLAFAVHAARAKGRGETAFNAPIAKSARLLLCWSIPLFILLELIPTKLPHYPLPIYPAWALMAGTAIMTLAHTQVFKSWRRIGAILFAFFSIALIVALLGAEAYYGENNPIWSFGVLSIVILLCLYAMWKMWNGKSQSAFKAVIISAVLTSVLTYQFTLPSLKSLQISKQVKSSLEAHNIDLPNRKILSTQFTEPSLVYRLGTHIMLGKPEERLADLPLSFDDIVILDHERAQTPAFALNLRKNLRPQNMCLESLDTVKGVNYAKGDKVNLELLQIKTCAISPEPAKSSEQPTTTPGP